MVRSNPRPQSVERDRLLAQLLLRWSRTLDDHRLSFERWLAVTGAASSRAG